MTDAEQLRMGVGAPRRSGPWERRAEHLLRAVRKAHGLTASAAGYGDSLRMAGRDRDRVEADPDATHHARQQARRGWDESLMRLVPPPNSGDTATDDPFTALDDRLRS